MNRTVLIALFLFCGTLGARAQEIDKTAFKGYDTALVIYDMASGKTIDINPMRSAKRYAPCSTFKIYNTLIGLELNLLPGPNDPWYRWDGVHRAIDGWNKDLTLKEAFGVSAVPAFQALARQIGEQRMKHYIDAIHYGSQDISSGIDTFWLPRPGKSSILISAGEQAKLISDLLQNKLPFSPKNIQTLKDIMRSTTTDKGTLYGKTGTRMAEEGTGLLGWFVGFLESGGKTYTFACNITDGDDPSGKKARAIVESVLRSLNLF